MQANTSLPLSGKRALVTGASRGIGRSIAIALAEAGADVAITSRKAADLLPVQAEIEALGRKALSIECDVTDPGQVQSMAGHVLGEWQSLDILVNNAGNGESHPFIEHPDELWHRMLLVNLTSVYYVTKAFAPAMSRQHWGRIINIASIAARSGDRYVAAYTAAKHGVLGLTRALAVEFMPNNVTVNAICPGFVDTPMTEASVANIVERSGLSKEQALAALEKKSPQRRLIEPGEVAAMAVYLAGEMSKGITGQAINIDGGGVMS